MLEQFAWVESLIVLLFWIGIVGLGLWATSALFPRVRHHSDDPKRK